MDKLPKELQDIILYDFLNIKLAYGDWHYKLSFAKIKEFAEKYDKIPKIYNGGYMWIKINDYKYYHFYLSQNIGIFLINNNDNNNYDNNDLIFKLH
jgi:hypothetical protein